MVRKSTKINIHGIPAEILTKEELKEVAEEEGIIITCMPTAYGTTHVSGSTREKCEKCDQEVWMSPATKASKPDKAITYCMKCALQNIKEEGYEPECVITNQKQIDEIERINGEN